MITENNIYKNKDISGDSNWVWSTIEVVSSESISLAESPTIAVDSEGNVHCVWNEWTGTDVDILYKRWNATTSSWSTTEIVSTESTGWSKNARIKLDSFDNAHIVWYDDTNYAGSGTDKDIFYKYWNASTFSWSTTEVVSTESTEDSYFPSLDLDSEGNVHVAWRDYTNYTDCGTDTDIFYKYRDSTLDSWTTTEVISTESTSGSYKPSISVDHLRNVHIAWFDLTSYAGSGTDWDIFYKYWNASTFSWSTTEIVSTESTDWSEDCSIDVDSVGNVHIAWSDPTNYNNCGADKDVFYKYWNISTSSWMSTEVISTESSSNSVRPSLKVDSVGNVHVAWHDETNYTNCGTDNDIFYKYWNVSTSSWMTTEVVSIESTENSIQASLVIGLNDSIHIAWQDATGGDPSDDNIFYRFKKIAEIDSSPPTITDITLNPVNPTQFEQITISADITDNIGIHNATLYYRIDVGSWFNVLMTPLGSVYTATIGPFIAGSTIDYYLVAYDTFGNRNQSSTMNFGISFISPEITYSSGNVTMLEGSEEHNITWIATDDNPDHYFIYSNGRLERNSTWLSDSPVVVWLHQLNYPLDIGTFNFTIVFFDLDGNFVKDTVFVTVISVIPEFYRNILISLPSIAALVIIFTQKRRKKS
ncbi:MAG: hypothetical protein ACTSR2_04630 [Candidatus Hodarchaeales archaeon]